MQIPQGKTVQEEGIANTKALRQELDLWLEQSEQCVELEETGTERGQEEATSVVPHTSL
jgi:hypothetical protein